MAGSLQRRSEGVCRSWRWRRLCIYSVDSSNTNLHLRGDPLSANSLRSQRRVYQEVAEQEQHKNDELAKWMRHRREKRLCIPASKQVHGRIQEINEHIFTKYTVIGAMDFLKALIRGS
jgi:hypothetical protein